MEENNVVTMPLENVTDINVGDNVEQNENISGTDNNVPTKETPQSFKVKHLHEEKEVTFDEAPTYIQKGLDYDRVKSKYEDSKPVVGFVEKLAQQNGMTVPEYLKAVEEYERQQEIESLANKNSLAPELAEELYLLRQERQQRQIQKQEYENQTKQNQEYIDFMNQFPDIKPESIPKEVWQTKADTGISLTDAYIRNEYNKLKSQNEAKDTNVKNASSSTGSLTGNGSAESSYIDYNTFNNNKHDRNWVVKNLEKIQKSRAKW